MRSENVDTHTKISKQKSDEYITNGLVDNSKKKRIQAKPKFKKPKNGAFNHYCFQCKYWEFIEQTGCSYDGVCLAVSDEYTIQDAYDGACGLFCKKIKGVK